MTPREKEPEKTIDQIVSENIRKYRKAKDLTQQQLADIIGCEKNNVQRWENGVYPKPENIYSLSKSLDVSQSQLFITHDSNFKVIKALNLLKEYIGQE